MTRKILGLAFLMLLAVGSGRAEEYQLRLTLGEYSEIGQDMADPEKFHKLTPKNILFQQELRVREGQKASAEISQGAKKVEFTCLVQGKEADVVQTDINVHYLRIVDVVGDDLIESATTIKGFVACLNMGIDTPISNSFLPDGGVVIWSVLVTKSKEDDANE